MKPPTVVGIPVGWYKNREFLEVDCPWCGMEHVMLVPDEIPTPFTTIVPCTGQPITVSSVIYHCCPQDDCD